MRSRQEERGRETGFPTAPSEQGHPGCSPGILGTEGRKQTREEQALWGALP